MAKSITYVGLDVHKDTIAVALAEAGLRGEVREHGKIPNTPAGHCQLNQLSSRLNRKRGSTRRLCHHLGTRLLLPNLECLGTRGPVAVGRHSMASRVEVSIDECMRRQKALGLQR